MPDSSPEFLALQQSLAGRFSIERELGRGGMGVVFLARDVALDRPVAIKLLPPAMAADAEFRERFLREARTAAQLSHPNIVPIHLVEERDGLVFFVMAFIEGESVGDRIRRAGALPTGDVIRMMQEVAWALAYAHGRGVVHRDVKPDNVMIERASGRAMLTDFGIARRTEAVKQTTPGMILGSLQYMAPEQADPDAVIDGRSDIYSLGVTAFHALTGRLPFDSDKATVLIAAHMLEPAPPVLTVAPNAPRQLAETIDRCLAKDPGARCPTGEAIAEALNDVRAVARAMPPSIRAFVSGISGAGNQIGLLGVMAAWGPMLVPDQTEAVLTLIAVILALPLLNAFMGARAVAIAGFSAEDVVQAIAADRKASDRYTEFMAYEHGRMNRWIQTGWGRFIAAFIGAAELAMAVGGTYGLFTKPHGAFEATIIAAGALGMGWFGIELIGHGLQVGPFRGRLARFMANNQQRVTRNADAFWRSWPIRGLLALGRLTSGRKDAKPVATRPTEVLLASAAADAYSSLPAGDRAALEKVPNVVRSLEAHAVGLRARKAALDASISAVGEPGGGAARVRAIEEMQAARARVEDQLREAVEALENLRLDLLKLRAGVGSTADLTEAIEAARRLGQEIDYSLAGRAEAARVLSPG